MSSPKDIRRFSEKWLEVFDWFEANPDKDYIVEADNKSSAHTLRFEFYRARSAMRKDAGLHGLYRNTEKREVTLNDKQVIFKPKDKTPLAELLDRSLKQGGEGKRQ